MKPVPEWGKPRGYLPSLCPPPRSAESKLTHHEAEQPWSWAVVRGQK